MTLADGILLHERYRIHETLGQGGMGAVYHAVDERLGVDVAVKENLFVNEAYARQFRREAAVLASLRSPSLPRVTDHFEEEGNVQYLVMDYIDGEDLRQRLERYGPINERDVIITGIVICDALTYLHTLQPKVIHRDIKPGNIRITPSGKVFLVDFGLVKMLHTEQSTTAGARAMTPGYSPPEQYGTSRTDPRSDIYSLGATLYAALTGAIPEDGLARIMGEVHLTPIRKHNGRISRPLAAVVEKAMAVQPADRFQSAEELKHALIHVSDALRIRVTDLTVTTPAALAAGSGRTTRPQPPLRTGGRSIIRTAQTHRPPWMVPLLVLFSLALMAFAVWSFTGFIGLIPRTMKNTTDPTVTITASMMQPSAASPTQGISATQTPRRSILPTEEESSTLFPVIPGLTGDEVGLGSGTGEISFVSKGIGPLQIYSINLDGKGLRQITRRPGGACEPVYSPTGERLVFVSPCAGRRELYERTNLMVLPLDGNTASNITNDFRGDFDPAWSPDSSQLAFTSLQVSGTPRVHLVALTDWRKQDTISMFSSMIVLSPEGMNASQPSWSPNGKRLAFISDGMNGSRLWIMNADGSDAIIFSPDDGYYTHPRWSPDGKTIMYNYQRSVNGIPNIYITPSESFSGRPFIDDRSPRMDGEFSPDGKWILYEAWPIVDQHDIWIASVDGEKEQKISIPLENSAAEFSPVWRPLVRQSPEFH